MIAADMMTGVPGTAKLMIATAQKFIYRPKEKRLMLKEAEYGRFRVFIEKKFLEASPDDVVSLLGRARERLLKSWWHGERYGVRSDGTEVEHRGGKAVDVVSWSLYGAIYHEEEEALGFAAHYIVGVVVAFSGYVNITEANLGCYDARDAVSFIDRAISLLGRSTAPWHGIMNHTELRQFPGEWKFEAKAHARLYSMNFSCCYLVGKGICVAEDETFLVDEYGYCFFGKDLEEAICEQMVELVSECGQDGKIRFPQVEAFLAADGVGIGEDELESDAVYRRVSDRVAAAWALIGGFRQLAGST